jgi:hypothetical protein
VDVPGGVVTVDAYRGHPVRFWLQRMGLGFLTLGYNAFSLLDEDVVIRSEDESRELYREGPYRGGGAQTARNRLVREIDSEGLEAFLRRRHVEEGRLGPLNASTGQMGFWEMNLTGLRALTGARFRKKRFGPR